MVGRAGWRADDISGALNILLARDERATDALELEMALRAERAATLRCSIVGWNSFDVVSKHRRTSGRRKKLATNPIDKKEMEGRFKSGDEGVHPSRDLRSTRKSGWFQSRRQTVHEGWQSEDEVRSWAESGTLQEPAAHVLMTDD